MNDLRIDLRSAQALEALDTALGRFAARSGDMVERLGAELDQRLESLIQECLRQHEAVESAREELDSCTSGGGGEDDDEEDEGGYAGSDNSYDTCREALQEAEDRLAELEGRRRRAQTAVDRCRRAARRLDELLSRTVSAAQHGLRQRVEALRDYHAVRLEDYAPAAPGPYDALPRDADTTDTAGPAIATSAAAEVAAPPDPSSFTKYPLPRGYVWVPLDQIDLDKGLSGIHGPQDWQKGISMEEMREGLETFRTQILPHLMADPRNASSEYFWKLDQQQGKDVSHGLQRIYDAFLHENNRVYLTRGQGDSKFDITNGRHRLKLARELGWTVIPAHVKDMNADGV